MGKLTVEEVSQKLKAKFENLLLEPVQPQAILSFDVTDKGKILQVLGFLKDTLGFLYLTDLTAIHYPEQENDLCVSYLIHNLQSNIRVRIKAYTSTQNPTIASATALWNGANWMERETYDFFGIQFEGHPDLRRILNVDEMTVFPMRKEYPLEDPNRVDKKDYFFGR